jgi:hypothetical protein
MTTEQMPQLSLNHPAQHRDRVGLTALFFGLCAAPFAWNAQLLVSSALDAHACYPQREPLLVPIWSGLFWILMIVGIVCFVLAIIGGLVSWRNWRLTRGEASGSAHHLLDTGRGRTRFLSMFGILTSCIFVLGVAFATAAVFVEPLCR